MEISTDNFEILSDSALKRLYKEFANKVEESEKKFKKTFYFSRVLKIVGTILCIVAQTVAFFYFWKPENAWYLIALAVLSTLCHFLVFYGILMLILKPFLCLVRKKTLQLHCEILEYEGLMYNIEMQLIANSIKGQEDIYKHKDGAYYLNQYKEDRKNIYTYRESIRDSKIECSKSIEWSWVASAVTVVIALIAVMAVYFVFAVVFVIFLVWLALYFATESWRDDKHRSSSDYNTDYSKVDDEPRISLTSLYYRSIGHVYADIFDLLGMIYDYRCKIKDIKKYSKYTLGIIAKCGYNVINIERILTEYDESDSSDIILENSK